MLYLTMIIKIDYFNLFIIENILLIFFTFLHTIFCHYYYSTSRSSIEIIIFIYFLI